MRRMCYRGTKNASFLFGWEALEMTSEEGKKGEADSIRV